MREGAGTAKPLAGRVDQLEALAPPHRSQWKQTLVRFSCNVSGMLGLVLVLIVVISSLAAPLLTQADPNDTDVRNAYAPSSRDHPFGTDNLGRDVFSLMFFGATTFGSTFLLVIIFVELFFSRRVWCRSICPTGALLGWLGSLSLVRLRKEEVDLALLAPV